MAHVSFGVKIVTNKEGAANHLKAVTGTIWVQI